VAKLPANKHTYFCGALLQKSIVWCKGVRVNNLFVQRPGGTHRG